MKGLRAIAFAAALLILAPASGQTRGGHGGGGGHVGGMMGHPGGGGGWWGHAPGHPVFFHGGPRVFVGGGFGFPFFWPSYSYGFGPAYAYPYPYGDYPYPYPGTYLPGYPPPDAGTQSPPPDAGSPTPEYSDAQADAQDQGTYGLIQLRGVPDGASVYLDARFWFVAHSLGGRWLALPGGGHAITVRLTGYREVSANVEVVPGTNRVVEIQPLRAGDEQQELGGPAS